MFLNPSLTVYFKMFNSPKAVIGTLRQMTLIRHFKTVLSSGYILILLSIEYILASLIEMCQG